MGLMTCPECQGKLSTEAQACPHCGWMTPRTSAHDENKGCAVQAIGVILLFFFPVGTALGVILIAWGGTMARRGRQAIDLGALIAVVLCFGAAAWVLWAIYGG